MASRAHPSVIHLLFLATRCRCAGLRFGGRARLGAGRLLLVGLGLLRLSIAPLLTFRHRRSPCCNYRAEGDNRLTDSVPAIGTVHFSSAAAAASLVAPNGRAFALRSKPQPDGHGGQSARLALAEAPCRHPRWPRVSKISMHHRDAYSAPSGLPGNTSTRSDSEMKVIAPARVPPPITYHRPPTTADARP
jgi:hypothetical protein